MIKAAVNLAVSDVKASSAWYRKILACSSPLDPNSDHRSLFDLLVDAEGNAVLILSKWDHNPLNALNSKDAATPGHGVVLFFTVPHFEEAWEEARSSNAKIIEPPHPSRGFEVLEFTVLDPEGYTVTVSKAS